MTDWMFKEHKKAIDQMASPLLMGSPDKMDVLKFAYKCYQLGQESITVTTTPTMLESQRAALLLALKATKGHRVKAAQLLGVGKTTVYRMIKAYEFEKAAAKEAAGPDGAGTRAVAAGQSGE